MGLEFVFLNNAKGELRYFDAIERINGRGWSYHDYPDAIAASKLSPEDYAGPYAIGRWHYDPLRDTLSGHSYENTSNERTMPQFGRIKEQIHAIDLTPLCGDLDGVRNWCTSAHDFFHGVQGDANMPLGVIRCESYWVAKAQFPPGDGRRGDSYFVTFAEHHSAAAKVYEDVVAQGRLQFADIVWNYVRSHIYTPDLSSSLLSTYLIWKYVSMRDVLDESEKQELQKAHAIMQRGYTFYESVSDGWVAYPTAAPSARAF